MHKICGSLRRAPASTGNANARLRRDIIAHPWETSTTGVDYVGAEPSSILAEAPGSSLQRVSVKDIARVPLRPLGGVTIAACVRVYVGINVTMVIAESSASQLWHPIG